MTSHTCLALLLPLVLGAADGFFYPDLDNFMDCPGNDDIWGILRVCCPSPELPNDCECFDISPGTDFTNSNFQLPKCPEDLNVAFLLFTPSESGTGTQIKGGDPSSLDQSDLDPSLPTIFLAHGFMDSGDADWIVAMKDELLANVASNVIIVDWREGAGVLNYYKAVANTRTVGAMVGRLVMDINEHLGATLESFHLVGHSLGAHIMGYAGKEVHRLTGNKPGRITGLDPAGLSFESYSEDVRVDKSDAQFVDIMHTDAESLLYAAFGTRYSIGHVDHYPNGGKNQPGCEGEDIACSHMRAVYFFTYSISQCRYDPPDGDTDCTMGYHVSSTCRGDYYPETTDTEPFC